MAAYAVFAAYAVLFAVFSRGEDQVWAIWASCGYAVALFMLWRWPARTVAALVSVAVAVIAPLLWLSVAYPLETGMMVIDRSATLLLHHGSPYLTSQQVTSWVSYNPYLTVMTLFGLPSAAGLGGLAGNSGVWIAVVTVAILAAAFWVAVPHRRCDSASPGGTTPPKPPPILGESRSPQTPSAPRCLPPRRAACHRGRRGLSGDRPQPRGDHHRPAGAGADPAVHGLRGPPADGCTPAACSAPAPPSAWPAT